MLMDCLVLILLTGCSGCFDYLLWHLERELTNTKAIFAVFVAELFVIILVYIQTIAKIAANSNYTIIYIFLTFFCLAQIIALSIYLVWAKNFSLTSKQGL